MKRIAVLLLVCLLLVGCQPTPDEEFVKNKTDGTLEEIIHADTEPAPDRADAPAPDEKSPLYAQLGVPERFTMEPETRTVPFSNLTVSANAVVVLPNVSAIPVYEASGKTIPDEQLEAIAQALFGDAERYASENGTLRWKLEDGIRTDQKRIETIQTNPEEHWDGEKEQWQEDMQYLAGLLADAPEDYQCKPWNGSFSDGLMVRIADKHYNKMRSFPNRLTLGSDDRRSTVYGIYYLKPDAEPCAESEAAKAIAEEFMQRSGLSETFVLERVQAVSPAEDGTGSSKEITGYEFSYVPVYDGVKAQPYWTTSGSDTAQQKAAEKGLHEMPEFDAYLGPENMIVTVENGRIVHLDWSNYVARGERINENVKLLPFSEIEKAFKNAIFTGYFTDEGVDRTLIVTRVELNLMRMKRKDVKDAYYIVPVWDFLGYSPDWGDGEPARLNNAYVTINAVDGTRINRTNGY